MNKEQALIKKHTKIIRKYFISKTAKIIIVALKGDYISDYTIDLITSEGYSDAYTALAHQCVYVRNDSYAAIVSEMKYIAKSEFEDLPDFALELMKYECADSEKIRLRFCNEVLRKALSQAGKDVTTAKNAAKKKLLAAKVPF